MMKQNDYNKTYELGDETWRGSFVNPVLNNAIQMDTELAPKDQNVLLTAKYQCCIDGCRQNLLTVLWQTICGNPSIIAYETEYADDDCADIGINGLNTLTRIGDVRILSLEEANAMLEPDR